MKLVLNSVITNVKTVLRLLGYVLIVLMQTEILAKNYVIVSLDTMKKLMLWIVFVGVIKIYLFLNLIYKFYRM